MALFQKAKGGLYRLLQNVLCNLVNTIENKFCSACAYPLIPSAFEEIKEQENSRFRSLEERFDEMQSMIEKLMAGLGEITDQQQINVMAKSFFSSGLLTSTDNA